MLLPSLQTTGRLNIRSGWLAPLLALALAMGTQSARAQGATSPYTLYNIGTVSGWQNSFPTGINANDQIVGFLYDYNGVDNSDAFLWDPVDGFTDISAQPGGAHGWANALNSQGQVVGVESVGSNYHAFLWSSLSGIKDLGTVGSTESEAYAINDSGQVVGCSGPYAILWNSTGPAILGPLLGGAQASAMGINNAGQVVGWSTVADGSDHAFLWSKSGGMVDLGPGVASTWWPSIAINNNGQVTGWYLDSNQNSRLFLWTQSGGRTDIGISYPYIQNSYNEYFPAVAINDQGQIAGLVQTSSGSQTEFVWSKKGGKVEVGVPANEGWPFSSVGINNSGIVLGDGATTLEAFPFTFSVSPAEINAGKTAKGVVTIPFAGTSAATVQLTSSSKGVTVPASITIPAGKTSASFSINSTSAAANSVVNIGAKYNGWSFRQSLTVPPVLQYLTVVPTTVGAGGTALGTVAIPTAAVAATTITLTASNSDATVPATITIPAGLSTVSFTVQTNAKLSSSASVTINAACGGSEKSASLIVTPVKVSSLTLSSSDVTASTNVTGTVKLSLEAPSSGVKVNLTGQTSAISYPASITVPSGSSSATFTVNTSGVKAATKINVVATNSLNGTSSSAALVVQPNISYNMSLSPWTVLSGGKSTMTLTLASAAPAGGLTFALATSNTAVATFASSTMTVATGKTTGTVTLTGGSVSASTTVTLGVTLGSTTHTCSLTVAPIPIKSLSLSPSTVTGGNNSTGTVTLSSATPKAISVALSSSNSDASVPATVSVAAGKSSATFKVTTKKVSANASVTISASYAGSSQQATLTVKH